MNEIRPVPRVAAIHDLSGVGRCSLSVILPVLSAMGVQVCPLTTALLSTHTGGFGEVDFVDLTDHIEPFYAHWQREGLHFDCLYSGFLGSERQIGMVEQMLAAAPAGTLRLVDPVMGDGGKPYRTYTGAMCAGMRRLVMRADVITPNLTEACLLLERPYPQAPLTRRDAEEMLLELCTMGPTKAVITGLCLHEGQLTNLGLDQFSQTFFESSCEQLPAHYPGTGDLFTALLTGTLVTGSGFQAALDLATGYVHRAIRLTAQADTPPREGVLFEKLLTLRPL